MQQFKAPQAARHAIVSARLGAYCAQWTEGHNFSGTILVAQKNNVLFRGGYGYANPVIGLLNGYDTSFLIGSLTKMFTAVAILRLHEEGKLNVLDTLKKYIPAYPRGFEITIHHQRCGVE